jgi:hypothetical protein
MMQAPRMQRTQRQQHRQQPLRAQQQPLLARLSLQPRRAPIAAAASSASPLARAAAAPSLQPRRRLPSLAPPPLATKSNGPPPTPTETNNNNAWPYSAALLALWLALLTYVFRFAPNQTPTLDNFVVLKLIGQKAEDPYVVNPVFEAVFNIMGVYPAIFGSLLVPGGRSGRRSEGPLGAPLPAWPFVAASFGLGAYALIPYMALWAPPEEKPALPPPREETKGWSRLFLRGAESPVLPALLLAVAAYWISRAATAPPDAWLEYLRQFDSSRLVHATTVDFALCTALVPFWLTLDAEGRRWEGSKTGAASALALVPVLGPCLYLLLRPKSGDGEEAAGSE